MNIYELLNQVENEQFKSDKWNEEHSYYQSEVSDKRITEYPVYVDIDGEGHCVRVDELYVDSCNNAIVLRLAK